MLNIIKHMQSTLATVLKCVRVCVWDMSKIIRNYVVKFTTLSLSVCLFRRVACANRPSDWWMSLPFQAQWAPSQYIASLVNNCVNIWTPERGLIRRLSHSQLMFYILFLVAYHSAGQSIRVCRLSARLRAVNPFPPSSISLLLCRLRWSIMAR